MVYGLGWCADVSLLHLGCFCLSFCFIFLALVVFLDFLVLKQVCVDCRVWQLSLVLSVVK